MHRLDSILSAIEVNEEFSNCTDVQCKDIEHMNAADELILTILDSVDKAASETLHNAVQSDPTKPKKIPVPGWSAFVKPGGSSLPRLQYCCATIFHA